ncbi:MAG: sugar phosphate isomerase/epimerase family protein [Armatimonadota bacterium]|nr:sugar phosphate isomerase/epimerase family protein [Armatimonadota bacterium]
MNYSATTVLLPEYSMEETAELLGRLGFDGAEWRVRRIPDKQRGAPYSPWGNVKNDLPPERLAAEAERLRRVSRDNGLAIAGIASNALCTDLDDVKRLAEGCAACGAPFFRLMAPSGYSRTRPYPQLLEEAVDAFGKALEIVRPYKVKVAVEIHMGTLTVSASQAYLLVRHFPPEEIGVIYDFNNMTKEGFETWRMGMELLGPYLLHVHIGNHAPRPGEVLPDGTQKWVWEGVPLEKGLTDIAQGLSDLKAVGYTGFISLEDFRAAPAEEKLRDGLRYLKAVEARI